MAPFGSRFNASKVRNLCKQAGQRMKLVRCKKEKSAEGHEREIASLIERGKAEGYRIRVEALIRERDAEAAIETLELLLELLSYRVGALDSSTTGSPPEDAIEAIDTILFASYRMEELPELGQIREYLQAKVTKEHAKLAADGDPFQSSVNERVKSGLSVEPPSAERKCETLEEIANKHNLAFDKETTLSLLTRKSQLGSSSHQPRGKQDPPSPPASNVQGLSIDSQEPDLETAGYPDAKSASQAAAMAAEMAIHAAKAAARHAGTEYTPSHAPETAPSAPTYDDDESSKSDALSQGDDDLARRFRALKGK